MEVTLLVFLIDFEFYMGRIDSLRIRLFYLCFSSVRGLVLFYHYSSSTTRFEDMSPWTIRLDNHLLDNHPCPWQPHISLDNHSEGQPLSRHPITRGFFVTSLFISILEIYMDWWWNVFLTFCQWVVQTVPEVLNVKSALLLQGRNTVHFQLILLLYLCIVIQIIYEIFELLV